MGELERVLEEPTEPIDVSDADVHEAIATCGGDAGAAVRALLIAGQFLERELEEARQQASCIWIAAEASSSRANVMASVLGGEFEPAIILTRYGRTAEELE